MFEQVVQQNAILHLALSLAWLDLGLNICPNF